MNKNLYIRGLKNLKQTVLCVAEGGQKIFFDPLTGRKKGYASGQQIKRSIMLNMLDRLGETEAPLTFIHTKGKKKDKKAEGQDNNSLGQGQILNLCDPSFTDQLIGGYMSAGTELETLKRRSPLSVSHLVPLHPNLASTSTAKGSFDRSATGHLHTRIMFDEDTQMSEEEIEEFLSDNNKVIRMRSWLDETTYVSGLYTYDVAIDLEALYTVPLSKTEPQISSDTEQKLRENGWVEATTGFGPSLLAPKEIRDKITPALAQAIVEFRTTTNQSRNFNLQDTLAIAVTERANEIKSKIRARVVDEEGKAVPVINQAYVGFGAEEILPVTGSETALTDAANEIAEKINAWYARYETETEAA